MVSILRCTVPQFQPSDPPRMIGVIDKPDAPRQKLVTPFGTTGMVGSSGSKIRGRDDSDDDFDD